MLGREHLHNRIRIAEFIDRENQASSVKVSMDSA